MRWFLPSWKGDFRIESDDKNPKLCHIEMVEPTAAEQNALTLLGAHFKTKGWIDNAELWPQDSKKKTERVAIAAPLSKVAPAMARVLKGGRQTLSAVKFTDGQIETVEGTSVDLDVLAQRAEAAGAAADSGVSAKRPTPCCPQCHQGAIEPATEVLLSFLDQEQHEQWAADRTLIAIGGYTGNRYMLAHRHSSVARYLGRICVDLTDEVVLHFHDFSVPPEEEVLAAKLVLEHRENWLRNEATMLTALGPHEGAAGINRYGRYVGSFEDAKIFKNPLGDHMDGVWDASVTAGIGTFLLLKREEARQKKRDESS